MIGMDNTLIRPSKNVQKKFILVAVMILNKNPPLAYSSCFSLTAQEQTSKRQTDTSSAHDHETNMGLHSLYTLHWFQCKKNCIEVQLYKIYYNPNSEKLWTLCKMWIKTVNNFKSLWTHIFFTMEHIGKMRAGLEILNLSEVHQSAKNQHLKTRKFQNTVLPLLSTIYNLI